VFEKLARIQNDADLQSLLPWNIDRSSVT
jgi:hypothetical protein